MKERNLDDFENNRNLRKKFRIEKEKLELEARPKNFGLKLEEVR